MTSRKDDIPREIPGGTPGLVRSGRESARPPELPGATRQGAPAWVPAPLDRARRGLAPLGEVLVRTHEAMHQKTGALMTADEWRAIVGERIAKRTRVGALVRGDLIVNVASSAWAQELGFLIEDILRRLRDAGRDVGRIKLRVEPGLGDNSKLPRPFAALKRKGSGADFEGNELPPELASRLAQIDDPHLRAAISEAAQRSLNRGPRR